MKTTHATKKQRSLLKQMSNRTKEEHKRRKGNKTKITGKTNNLTKSVSATRRNENKNINNENERKIKNVYKNKKYKSDNAETCSPKK